MSYNPESGFPRVAPELVYQDVAAAAAWLTKAFGFRERLRFTLENGTVAHVDMELDGGVIMLAAGDEDYQNPVALGHACCNLVVFVRDVDRHYQHARSAGAKTLSKPATKPWGLRQYRAEDLEGHLFEFSQHIRDVEPEEWGAKRSAGGGSP